MTTATAQACPNLAFIGAIVIVLYASPKWNGGGQERRGSVLYYNPLTYRLAFEQGNTEWLEEKQVIKK